MSRGKTKTSKADLVYDFKNGSKLDILAASQRSRGARRTGGLIEECILIDEDILNEVLIPTLNINRRLTDGSRDENEPANKALVFVTTAGWKNSFARPLEVIGELKPCEPQNEGVMISQSLLMMKASKDVTLCQAA